jgi:hypothetical protein
MLAILNTASVFQCPHGLPLTHVPSQPRVKLLGSEALVLPDLGTVSPTCPFTLPGGKPSPCSTLRWTTAATRVKANSQPVLLQSSLGLCNSPEQAPQGAPIPGAIQPRVSAL